MRSRAELCRTKYSAKAALLDIPVLRREWTEACASNFVVRSGRKNKVRAALEPYCTGEMAEDVGRDLAVLEDIGVLLREIEALKPLFANMAHLWKGAATDVSRFEAMILWATNCRARIEALAGDEASADILLESVRTQLKRDPVRFRQAGKSRTALERMHRRSWSSMHADAKDLGDLVGLDRPEELVNLEPRWIDALVERTARWKANLIRAPHWATWQNAAQAARAAGLGPLIDGVEAGTLRPDQLLRGFDYAYARWVAETIVNEDEVLSGFLAESTRPPSRPSSRRSKGRRTRQTDRQGADRRRRADPDELWQGSGMGHAGARDQQEGAAHAAAPAVRADPERH